MLALLLALATAGPDTFVHQGRMLDALGEPYSGDVAAEFRLYDDAAKTVELFDSGVMTVPMADGYYSVELGPLSEPARESGALWLEITLNDQALTPLQELHGVPFGGSTSGSGTSTSIGFYASAQEAADAGLTDHWLFDGNTHGRLEFGARNLSGVGASYLSNTSPFTGLDAGTRPSVIDLDGVNDFLRRNDKLLTGQKYTILMWLYMDAGNPAARSYLLDGRGDGDNWYYLFDGNNSPSLLTPCMSEASPPNIGIQGRWTLHAIRSNGSSASLIIDNSATYNQSMSNGGSCFADVGRMTVGTFSGANAGGSSGQHFFNGKVAEIAIYDGTYLTNSRVDAIFSAKLPLLYTP